jgi:glycosyltransferase involved in cell wall biosynthesis
MQRWVNFFAEQGHEISTITWHPPDAGAYVHPNIRIHRFRFPPHSVLRYGALLELILIIRKEKPDIIHAHYIGSFGVLASLYKKITGFSPVFMTAWGSDILIEAKGANQDSVTQALARADLITCDAIHMKDAMVKLGAQESKIQIIYFGTDIKKFVPDSADKSVREKFGISTEPVIISLRSFEPIYDIATLIRAIPQIKDPFPDVRIILGGRGSLESELRNLAMDLGVMDSIIFAGFIQSNELPAYFASADVYVSTSLSDAGLAASTAEAMACGLPVVISDFGENREWVEHGNGGFLFPLGDHNALAAGIVPLLADDQLRIRFGRKNRQIIEERNNYYIEMEKVRKLYESFLKGVSR